MELVRDEWDRDLLHVSYDSEKITEEEILAVIEGEGFEAEAAR